MAARDSGRDAASGGDPEDKAHISEEEAEEVEDRSSPRSPVIYEIVRRTGEEEMARPAVSLFWSGIAAGISISFSPIAEAVLRTHLPDVSWRPLIEALGYPVGFLIVILSRQQLFTENTITVVLPVMARPTWGNFGRLLAMWGIVFLANLLGTLVAGLFLAYTPALPPDLLQGMVEISREVMTHDWITMFFRGIGAGFLIAAMVWMMPSAVGTQFFVIGMMTYVVAVSGFTHIVAGSVEAFLLVAGGELGIGQMLLGFTLPVLLGNVIGGTALFAVLAYAQVMKEI